MERYIPCASNNKDCKYRTTPNGCHTSEHHIYPRRTAETKLERAFGNLSVNKIIACRYVHDILDNFPPPEYPDEEKMIRVFGEERGREWR